MSSAKRIIHVISHTHWDREWYMPYEAHHVKLIQTMDALLATLESDPEFRSFYLDGQTIVLDDYLQIYPEKRELLREHVQAGRLSAGPWYVLQDEFLTSSEANVRNLQVGHRDAKAFGPVSKVGYFPDSFGNMGQAAQLLRQAGIDNAVFGRGVKATGFNNQVGEEASLESPYSELIWESPDGSQVLGILFANWYNNGMEIPVRPDEAKAYWDQRIAAASRYASTPHLLLMNGCDHQPVQTNLSEALEVARKLYPEHTFIHSNFDDYIRAVRESLPPKLSLTRGELRGQKTDGLFTLVNTASARVPIKQLNQQNQTLLEKIAEPLAALAHGEGKPYPHALLQYAWKTLMQNHPHDSICGCSVDEVYREMRTRFAKSMEVAKAVVQESAAHIGSRVDTARFGAYNAQDVTATPFVVFNTSGYDSSSVISVEVECARRFFDQSENPVSVADEVRGKTHARGYLVNERGDRIACTVSDLGVRFGYELPDDKFRQPYYARALRLTFETGVLPGIGYSTFAWISDDRAAPDGDAAAASLITGDRTLENDLLRVTVEADGGLTLLDKRSNQLFRDLGHYEDTGDIGNEYIYIQAKGDRPLTTAGGKAEIRVVEDTAYRATMEIVRHLDVPASADELLAEEMNNMVYLYDRQSRRSETKVRLTIVTRVSLERLGTGVRVSASFDNQAQDHRVRALFPSDVSAEVHYADSIFEIAERQNKPSQEWRNPSHCQHMQAFVDIHDERRGLTIAGLGLNEYEVLLDGRNTLAVTLLRSVGELGDWGVFPTPEAQCIGEHTAEWMIIPHDGSGSGKSGAYREAHRLPIPTTACQTNVHPGPLPASHRFLQWEGQNLLFSNLKANEDRGDWMARWYNIDGEPSELRTSAAYGGGTYRSNILEEEGSGADLEGKLAVGGYQIVTIGFRR